MNYKAVYELTLISIVLAIWSCQSTTPDQGEDWKAEVTETEKAFAQMAKDSGLHKAFVHFAAPDGVIQRNRTVLRGKKAISEYYEGRYATEPTLEWTPEFVDVSSSGDLAYTYGPYRFITVDSTGTENVATGIFHTVWKRQSDGSWKYVWD